ncbi:MAG TPA: hypothetical protein VK072_07640 [Candidatus Avamphibacillus sp.]|nr:hypothetical protein [Candidatus Avamphibacillus sp.]
MIVVTLIAIGFLFESVYENNHSLFLDLSLVIVAVAIACFFVDKLYKAYYMEEKVRPIYLDNSLFESCANEGLKQSVREIVVLIISLVLAAAAFFTFVIANNPKLLIVGSLGTATFLAFYYMKPLKRRRIIKNCEVKSIRSEVSKWKR